MDEYLQEQHTLQRGKETQEDYPTPAIQNALYCSPVCMTSTSDQRHHQALNYSTACNQIYPVQSVSRLQVTPEITGNSPIDDLVRA